MKFIKKRDLLILPVLAAVFATLYLFTRARLGESAVVEYDGKILARFELTGEQQSYTLPQNPNVELAFGEQGAYFVHSDCPDRVCVHAGVLTRAGETAACLPNNVIIYVEGEGDGDVDVML